MKNTIMPNRVTATDVAVLRDYLRARLGEDWSTWPPANAWPVPPELRPFVGIQCVTPTGNVATLIRFEHPIELPDHRVGHCIGVGATSRLHFEVLAIDV